MLGCIPRFSPGKLLATAAVTLAACTRATDAPVDTEPARLAVQANVAATTIATMVIKVTAPDIPTPLVFNMKIASGSATGSLQMPAGSDRKLELDAFDANQIQTHHGEKTVSVKPGSNNPAVSITLLPIAGEQPVTAQLGNYAVSVSPTSATLILSGAVTAQLTATVTDDATPPNTITPAPAELKWATTHPAFFDVDANGLVTALKAGSGSVVVTYKGYAATAAITVQ
jgi:uncharacterized protein YjdB